MSNSDFKYTIYLIENNSKTWYHSFGTEFNFLYIHIKLLNGTGSCFWILILLLKVKEGELNGELAMTVTSLQRKY